jgi:hypothetical protein
MKKLTRDRVVPTISAKVSWLMLGITASGSLAGTPALYPTPFSPGSLPGNISQNPLQGLGNDQMTKAQQAAQAIQQAIANEKGSHSISKGPGFDGVASHIDPELRWLEAMGWLHLSTVSIGGPDSPSHTKDVSGESADSPSHREVSWRSLPKDFLHDQEGSGFTVRQMLPGQRDALQPESRTLWRWLATKTSGRLNWNILRTQTGRLWNDLVTASLQND